jgi:isopentenyl diphosphate isomerase/L-lactate dehydrogenase-like FMN-dependent dehydrogenase
MTAISCVEYLRAQAEKRVPRMVDDQADSGSRTESTYGASETDFTKIKLRRPVAVNMEGRSLAIRPPRARRCGSTSNLP